MTEAQFLEYCGFGYVMIALGVVLTIREFKRLDKAASKPEMHRHRVLNCWLSYRPASSRSRITSPR
jgi:hypothetical protein